MQSSRGHLMVSCKSPALTPKKTAAAAAGSGLQQNGAPPWPEGPDSKSPETLLAICVKPVLGFRV